MDTDTKRVLCVDDDETILKSRKLLLEAANYSVQTASSGAQALEMLAAGAEVDVVLLDYLMPGMNGDELAAELRQRLPHLRLVAVSAVGQLPPGLLAAVDRSVQKGQVMFRLVQECLTNIHRHSGSKVATIEITRKGASVSLEVQDEGKGISPQRLTALQSQASGVGLRGMRERVRQFEGEINIESSEKGTRIAFTIPLGEATDIARVGLDEQLQNAG